MASSNIKMKISVDQIRYCVLFLPVAKYQRVGDVSLLSVFGVSVYERVGCKRALFGFMLPSRTPEGTE